MKKIIDLFKLKRFIVILIVLMLILIGISVFLFLKHGHKNVTAAPALPVVNILSIKKVAWIRKVDAIGTLKAKQGVKISAPVSGTLKDLSFSSGAQVHQGELLATLDNQDLAARVNQDEAKYQLAQQDYGRYQKLNALRMVSSAYCDRYRSAMAQTKAQLAYDQAALDKTMIKAPFSGRLGIRCVDKGQYITAGQTIVSLQDISVLYVDFYLSEKEVSDVALNTHVKISLNPDDQVTWSGKIIAMGSELDEKTRNLAVRAQLEPPYKVLLPGMYVRVSVLLPAKAPVVAIPQEAVSYNPYGNFVYVYKDGSVHRQIIETGERFDDLVVVTKGLQQGDQIVVEGQQKLFDGAKVNIQEQDTKA